MTNNQVRAFGAMVDAIIEAVDIATKRQVATEKESPFDNLRRELYAAIDELAPLEKKTDG